MKLKLTLNSSLDKRFLPDVPSGERVAPYQSNFKRFGPSKRLFGRSDGVFLSLWVCLCASRGAARFGEAGWGANQRKNRLEALPHPLWRETCLRLLPGQRRIFDQGTRQEEHPVSEHHQQRLGIAGFGACPARLVSDGHRHSRGRVQLWGARPGSRGRQPGVPDRFGRTLSFEVNAGA